MANHASTKRAVRRTVTRTAINKSRKSRISTFIKKVDIAVAAGEKEQAKAALIVAQSEIAKGILHNLISKNTGARKVSLLAKKVKSICV